MILSNLNVFVLNYFYCFLIIRNGKAHNAVFAIFVVITPTNVAVSVCEDNFANVAAVECTVYHGLHVSVDCTNCFAVYLNSCCVAFNYVLYFVPCSVSKVIRNFTGSAVKGNLVVNCIDYGRTANVCNYFKILACACFVTLESDCESMVAGEERICGTVNTAGIGPNDLIFLNYLLFNRVYSCSGSAYCEAAEEHSSCEN